MLGRWYTPDPSTIDVQLHAVTMRSARMAVICISDAFVKDKSLCDLFHFLRTNLQKSIQLVVLGTGMDWKNSNIGMLTSSDVSSYTSTMKRIFKNYVYIYKTCTWHM